MTTAWFTSNKLNKRKNDVFQPIAYRPEPGTDSWALSTEKKLKKRKNNKACWNVLEECYVLKKEADIWYFVARNQIMFGL